MSRDRSVSLDRALRQRQNICGSGGYIPGRSPNRSPPRMNGSPRRVPSSPEVIRSHYQSPYCIEQQQLETPRILQYGCDAAEELSASHTGQTARREHYFARSPQVRDLPDELLDEYAEPSFYEPSPNATYDELMCILATPPHPQHIMHVEEVKEAGTSEIDGPIYTDNECIRKSADRADKKGQDSLCKYKIEPLPDDPRAIPPHPNDSKDVVAMIRRARAIQRLKEIEEAKAPKNVPKAIKKPGRGTAVSRIPAARRPQIPPTAQPQIRKKVPPPKKLAPLAKKKTDRSAPKPDHPPDSIAPEHAAAVLRARKLAGLKTKNPKLVPTSKRPPPQHQVKTPHHVVQTKSATPPPPPTYATILERAATIRAKMDAAKHHVPTLPSSRKIKSKISSVKDQLEQLDEFEALEELYNARPVESAVVNLRDQDENMVADRIENLQRRLLESPPAQRKISLTPKNRRQISSHDLEDQLDEFEALEQLCNVHPVPNAVGPREEDVNMLAARIGDLQQHLFEAPEGNICPSPVFELPSINRYYDVMKRHEEMLAETAASDECPEYGDDDDLQEFQELAGCNMAGFPTAYDENWLPTIEVPNFNIDDVPEYAFSAEAMAAAGFTIEDDVALGDVSMPCDVLEDDITLDEMVLEDITSPELNDLSISLQEPFEPDYPLEMSDYRSEVEEEQQKSPGFLTSVVSAVVDKFRNIFGGTPREDEEDAESCILDSSLPNLFETTPPPRTTTPSSQKPEGPEGPIVIPPHPKDPKDYATMIKRAQLIQKLKAREAAMAPPPPPDTKLKKKPMIKSSIPKATRKPTKKKKSEPPPKQYPPGEYSPSYAAAVARARMLAGYKNRSAVLNPERAAKIAALKAAEEALPPVERMQKRIARIIEKRGQLLCPRPSIETIGALEAIREGLPKPEMPEPTISKWTPAVRRAYKKSRAFSKKFERAFGKMKPMTPIKEEASRERDLMGFSPLRPHEGRLRLQYLQEQAEHGPSDLGVCPQTLQTTFPRSPQTTSPRTPQTTSPRTPQTTSPRTPEICPVQYSPIRLQSPTSHISPRTEQIRQETVTTTVGENGGEKSIREEVIETSTIENGEVHTTTRKITTTTDEFGNVTRHSEGGTGLTDGFESITENIDTIDEPDFMDTSYIPPSPRDPSIPTPSELIERIRVEVQQKLNLVLPDVPPAPEEPVILNFPEDLPDEELLDIDIPDLELTPPEIIPPEYVGSPNVSLPYCLGEIPISHRSPSPCKVPSPAPQVPQAMDETSVPKHISPDRKIVIPAHPKDPKDYLTMVKRAQAIQKLRAQQEAEKALAPKSMVVPSRKVKKSIKKKPAKPVQKPVDDETRECPAEPPPISKEYAAAVARARQLAGYKNRTAALNPTVAAKLAAKKAEEEAERAAFEALPEYQKIMKRMEKVRRLPTLNQKMQPSIDVLGTIAAIKATMPPIQEALPTIYPPPPSTKTRTQDSPRSRSISPRQRVANISLEEFKAIERQAMVDASKNISLDEFEALERETVADAEQSDECHENISLDEFKALERQTAAVEEPCDLMECSVGKRVAALEKELYGLAETPKMHVGARPRNIIKEFGPSVVNQQFHEELIADYANKRDELQTFDQEVIGDLLSSTPVSRKQRIREIREAQQRQDIPRNIDEYDESYDSPSIAYVPIPLLSPSGATCPHPPEEMSPRKMGTDDILLDLQTPKAQRARIKQFRDLEDMPFDELEFEDEPALTNISFEQPITPPPKPSELINRIQQQVQKRLSEEKSEQCQISYPHDLQFPDELPEEELFELSAPSFAQSPVRETPKRPQTPRISLPYVWGEVSPPTPRSPAVATPPPVPTEPEAVAKIECPQLPPAEGPIIIPAHPKDPKDYRTMVMRARALHKLQKRMEEIAAAPAPEPPKAKGEAKSKNKIIPKNVKPKNKEQRKPAEEDGERECPAEPPPLPEDYAKAVARARELAGYKNRTAALNPAVAAAEAAYAKLPEHDKLIIRMEHLRPKLRRQLDSRVKPSMEQLAFLQHMKDTYECLPPNFDSSHRRGTLSPLERISVTPRSTKTTTGMDESDDLAYFEALERQLSLTPRAAQAAIMGETNESLDEFEALERLETSQQQLCQALPQQNIDFGQHMADLQQKLYATEEVPELGDIPLAEFVALEALEASPEQCPALPPLELSQMIADMQQQQLATPPRIHPQERYRQLVTQMQAPPKTPDAPSPVKTPEIRYSPVNLHLSPTSPERNKRTEKITTHITKSGDNTIKDQFRETSEIVNGKMQHVTEHTTTTTDIDTSANIEELEDIGEPSFLDSTPITPTGAPRPRDIISRIQRDVQRRPRPDVPTGRLIELRTPPPQLPLPRDVPEEELLEMTCPAIPTTPTRTPTHSPRRSPERRTPNISIPELFMATPPPPTPPIPPVSPLRHRLPSPEGPIVIPPHPKDPKDYAAMVRRARKIQQLKAQEEADARAAQVALIAACKSKKKERVPISRWTAPPPKKATTRKKVLMKKQKPAAAQETVRECPTEPPPLPEGYSEEIARARHLAGLKNKTAALNPEIAKMEEAKASGDVQSVRPPAPGDFGALMAKIAEIREQGPMPPAQPSMATAAYLGAVKSAMEVMQRPLREGHETTPEPLEARYRRIITARPASSPSVECSPVHSLSCEDVHYTPIRYVSPRVPIAGPAAGQPEFDMADFEGLEDMAELGELEEPSFMEVSEISVDQSPRTPQPSPSRLIRRIREQVQQRLAECNLLCPSPTRTPPAILDLPENVTEDNLFELSIPSFVQTPQRQPTPTRSPNISIPRYFETTPPPPPKLPTLQIQSSRAESPGRSQVPAKTTALTKDAVSTPIRGICPGIRVKTPEGPIEIPPHPKDPTDVMAMIRRAQLIGKLKAKIDSEATAKMAAQKSVKAARVPISRRTSGQPARKAVKPPKTTSKLSKVDQKEEHKMKMEKTDVPIVCPPKEPPVLPSDYVAAVARARKLAGLKNTTDVLNPPRPPQDYATIKARAAAIKAQVGKKEPTARELAAAQNVINRRQRQERRRQLRELEQRRQEQGNFSLDFGKVQTPPPAMERYRALKSKMPSETPTTSHMPYSPVKTPEAIDYPAYKAIQLAPSPPCPFLQNISELDIGDISIPLDFQDDYDAMEVNAESNERNLHLSQRIKCLQNQFLQSPRQLSISPRAAHAFPSSTDSPDLAEFEYLEMEGDVIQPSCVAPSQNADLQQFSDDLKRLEHISRAQENLLCESAVSRPEDLYATMQQEMRHTHRTATASDEYNELDSFEAMERLCRIPEQIYENRLGEKSLSRPQHLSVTPRKSTGAGEYSALDSFEAMERLCRSPYQR